MSDTPDFGFGKFVPGFDFLQGLTKGASGGLPQMPPLASWVAPTVSVEELEKRVAELKAVQFWLEQNSRALTATIQALEVQKMTLATLKGMNVSMEDMASAFQPKTADAMMSSLQKAGETMVNAAQAMAGGTARASEKAAAAPPPEAAPQSSQEKEPDGAPASVVDPMQWWGALTQQFQQIAAHALKDDAVQAALDSSKNMATGLVKDALKTAADLSSQMAAKSAPHMPVTAPRSPKAAPATAPATRKAASKKAAPRKAAPRKAPARPAAPKTAARRPVSKSAR